MNYDPPGALTSKGWRLFKKEYKERAPIRYWLMHDLKYSVFMPVKWKYEHISDWIRYRTYDKYHIVKTGLKPEYQDLQTIMLHANFNLLKDFVEVEQAWSRYCWSNEYKENASFWEKYVPFYRVFFPFRNPEMGIAHFEWAATLDDPNLPIYERSDHQAEVSREILALYLWWVNQRPAREEAEYVSYDHQGLGDLAALDDDFDKNAEDYKIHVAAMDAASRQEDDWEKEDELMLIRLIKVRKELWT